MKKTNSVKVLVTFVTFFLAICILTINIEAHGAGIGGGGPTHQYISNESKFVWNLTPYEIKSHITNDIYEQNSYSGWPEYNIGDDVITGSWEEDQAGRFLMHFWNPDTPDFGKQSDYDHGLFSIFTSSYTRASQVYWWDKAIESYVKGDLDESYYWLGRLTHLLQDAAVPAHMHLDAHVTDKDEFELFIADVNDSYSNTQGKSNFYHWDGSDYENDHYKYENLISSFSDSDWDDVNTRLDERAYPSEIKGGRKW